MVILIIGLLIGLMIAGFGIYYLIKEKKDKESVKIYLIMTIAGLVVTAGCAIKLIIDLTA